MIHPARLCGRFDASAGLWRTGWVRCRGVLMKPGMECDATREGQVSLRAEVPEPLLQAMRSFLDQHPNWDQYRLVQAALAGFLVQHGSQSRAVTRCYLANIFPAHRSFEVAAVAGATREQQSSRPMHTSRRSERINPV